MPLKFGGNNRFTENSALLLVYVVLCVEQRQINGTDGTERLIVLTSPVLFFTRASINLLRQHFEEKKN